MVPVFPGAVKPKEPSEVLKAILDGVNPAHEAEVLAAMRARALPDATHLPSCCFFTFVNTAFGLTCATSTKGATMVAGGFEDSSSECVTHTPALPTLCVHASMPIFSHPKC